MDFLIAGEANMPFQKAISWRGVLLGLCLLTAAAGLRADTVYNNVGSTSDGTDPVTGAGPLEDSFTTGASSFSFGGVTVLLDTTDTTGTVTASLLSDSSGNPGSLITTLGTVSDSALGSTLADYTFNLSTPDTLAANTTYWIQLSSDDGSSAQWSWSLDSSAPGVSGQSFANIAGEFPSTYGSYQMSVNDPPPAGTVPTPEPGVFSLLAIGLAALVFASRRKLSRADS
jgi:hypothetical protein